MGCSSSKEAEAAVLDLGANNNAPSSTKGTVALSSSQTTTTTTPTAPGTNNSKATEMKKKNSQTTTAATTTTAGGATGTGTGVDGNKVAETLKMVQLNDVVDNDGKDNDDKRDRFLSYASGASTPNTSSDNLSFGGGGGGGGGGVGGSDTADTKSIDSADTTGSDGSKSKRNKKKLYKHRHTGSAIDLENMFNEHNCTSLSSKVVHIEVPFGRPIQEFYDGVHDGQILGSGISGLVRKVTHKKTGVEYAVKVLDLGLVGTEEGLVQLRDEIFIMCQLDHPNIVRLEEVYESHSEIYLVQELCVGGELFDRLDEQPDYHYTEAECARLIKQMLSSVRYLHSKGIIHRDLKLENFLFSSSSQDSELKMIDFGLSKHFRYGETLHEAVGTPYTVAPEVIKGTYDERCDIWAIGVIAFLLFSGDPPFGGCGGPEPLMVVRQNILNGDFEFEPADIWDVVSDLGKVFVKDLLVTDPKFRPTAREAQKHQWLRHHASRSMDGKGEDNVLNPNVVKALVNFKEFSDMRKLLSEVLSFTLLPDQIKDLRKEFEKMDTEGTGEISLDSLKQVLLINAGAGSLGALTEDEVVDIFNAMRVDKEETTIHWHEFIAAGLSQCRVDDRNLRLAFDRLDSDHKGYIVLNDIIHLVGCEDMPNEKEMKDMWSESMNAVGGTQHLITYDHFLVIMKGQTETRGGSVIGNGNLRSSQLVDLRTSQLPSVVEHGDDESVLSDVITTISSSNKNDSSNKTSERDFLQASNQSLPNMPSPSMHDGSESSLPTVSPLTLPILSPSSVRTKIDIDEKMKLNDADGVVPLVPPSARRRSHSMEESRPESPVGEDAHDSESPGKSGSSSNVLNEDTRRALNLPESRESFRNSNDENTNKSALTVNRQLYRAHRHMRISVLEASRRFEDNKTTRARDTLIKEKLKEAMGAGLVMRHGTKLQVTSEAIRKYMDEAMAEQRVLLEKANRRGGRGRRNRKKTISDMSAMMNPSMSQEEMGQIAVMAAASQTPDSKRCTVECDFDGVPCLPDLSPPKSAKLSSTTTGPSLAPKRKSLEKNIQIDPSSLLKHEAIISPIPPPNLPELDLKTLRKATVPGQFKKVQDPFAASGMYNYDTNV